MSKVVWRWKGDDVVRSVLEACQKGIDDTLLETRNYAAENHPWQNRSFTLQRSHEVNPAEIKGKKVRGEWGVREPYGFFLEVGTSRMQPFTWLRPAADVNYPSLPDKIRSHLR